MLVASTISAQAGFFTGNELHNLCTSSPGFAQGYVIGVADLTDLNVGVIDQATGKPVVPNKFICIPEGVVAQQVTDIACKYLEDHPENRQSPAPILVYQALLAAWRCPQQ
ncbi:hypothetical protein EB235_20010 [Mesorhizobium loti R88b]|uniref:Rap1a immunity protein domain-containing protein n=1 Tax=Mesorhizobium loti R88b TaxID=935548 RepID=A0A6M7WMY0_RHILI|nr:hypothetical protein EB235_20010 [Mesorhizobium loti R88b]